VAFGVNSSKIPASGFVVYGVTYYFASYGAAALMFFIIIVCYLFTMRIYQRQTRRIKSLKKFTIFSQTVSEYYVFLFATYLLIVVLGIVWMLATAQYVFMLSCIFLPLIYECCLVIYYNWKLNDYNLLGDVAAFNKKVSAFKALREEQQ
jgi:hypothetical protein